jgi:alpha-amylase
MGPDDGQGARWWSITADSSGNRLKYFSLFGSNMPDLNFDAPQVRDEVKGIAKFWLDRGADGFRLDAAKHIYGWTDKPTEADIQKNNAWWRSFSDFVYTIKPDAVLVGEVLGEERMLIRHARGLNALIDETFMKSARAEIQHPYAGFISHWKQVVQSAAAENPNKTYDSFTFLASHDKNPRLASELEANNPAEAVQRYRLGMCILMSASRFPILYQGDELMQRGWKWKGNSPNDQKDPGDGSHIYDETLREPVPWSKDENGPFDVKWQPPGHPGFLPKYDKPNDGVSYEEENADGHSVLALVRTLTNLRMKIPSFANGDLGDVLSDTADWLAFERVSGNEHYLVLINPSPQAKTYSFNDQWHPEWKQSTEVFWSDGQGGNTGASGQIQGDVNVAAFGMALLHRTGP